MNDEERRLWALNDEGLYNFYIQSRKPLKAWIKENRTFIDESVENALFHNSKRSPNDYVQFS